MDMNVNDSATGNFLINYFCTKLGFVSSVAFYCALSEKTLFKKRERGDQSFEIMVKYFFFNVF